jgi:hypothetical protein
MGSGELAYVRDQRALVGGLEAPDALCRAVLPDNSAGPTLRHVLQERRYVADGVATAPGLTSSRCRSSSSEMSSACSATIFFRVGVLLPERLQPKGLVFLQRP